MKFLIIFLILNMKIHIVVKEMTLIRIISTNLKPNLSGKVRYSPNYIFKNYQPESNKCLLIINQKNLRHILKMNF